jgi:hypothetical protein
MCYITDLWARNEVRRKETKLRRIRTMCDDVRLVIKSQLKYEGRKRLKTMEDDVETKLGLRSEL